MGQKRSTKSKSKTNIYLTLKPDRIDNYTNSNFYCHLNEPIQLTSTTEVALTDIIYSNSFLIDFGEVEIEYPQVLNLSYIKSHDSYESELKEVKEGAESLSQAVESRLNLLKDQLDHYKTQNDEIHQDQILAELNYEREGLVEIFNQIIKYAQTYSFHFDEVVNLCKIYSLIVSFSKTYSFENLKRTEDLQIISSFLIEIVKEANKIFILTQNTNKSVHVFNFKAQDRSSDIFDGFFDQNFFFYKDFQLKPYVKMIKISPKFRSLIENKKFQKNYFEHFRVFTNIIESHVSLNKNEPVLKLVKLTGHAGELIEKSYDRPEYHIVNKTYINRIHFEIRDNFDHLVDFKAGPIIIKLHFRSQK
jgi:hypothetical protein